MLKGGGSAAHLFPFYPRMRHIIPRNATALSGISLPLHRINETIASVFCQFRVGSGSVQGRSRVGALSLKGVLRAKVGRGKRESAAALRAGGTLASAPDTLACGQPGSSLPAASQRPPRPAATPPKEENVTRSLLIAVATGILSLSCLLGITI